MEGTYSMFLKKTKTKRGLYLQIAESYYDNGKSRQNIIEAIGYLDDLKKTYEDPIAFFSEKAKRMTSEKHVCQSQHLQVNLNEKMNSQFHNLYNVGYIVLRHIYNELNLSTFWKSVCEKENINYNLDDIFQLLTYTRILFPSSKKKMYENRNRFFEPFNVRLADIYRSLSVISKHVPDLQTWLFEHSAEMYSDEIFKAYLDCKNYYYNFEDTKPPQGIDKYTSNNISRRNHIQTNPMIGMGLLMNGGGIPRLDKMFGTEKPRSKDASYKKIDLSEEIVSISDDIYYIVSKDDTEYNTHERYLHGQAVRKTSEEFKKWAILQDDFLITETTENNERIIFKHKSRIHPEIMHFTQTSEEGILCTRDIIVNQKQMVYYSELHANRQKKARSKMLEIAQDLINNPKKYNRETASELKPYIINLRFDNNTGEILDRHLVLDYAKIIDDEKYDGYYSIVTSELSIDDLNLKNIYRNLANKDDANAVIETTLNPVPLYVWSKEAINAHFVICYTSLFIIKLLERRIHSQFSIAQLIEALQNYNCINISSNQYQFTYYSNVIHACGEAFDIDFSLRYRSRQQIRSILKY